MKAVLSRKYGSSQTTGRMVVFNQDKVEMQLVTLELPWNNNQHNCSCIPEGVYDVEEYVRPSGEHCFMVKDVPGRSAILIHKGNYNSDTHGCILPGIYFSDINDDGLVDVVESTAALNRLLNLMPEGFKLHII